MQIIRFPITPQTHVRTTQNEAYLFRMPEECPKHCGLPRRHKNAPMVEYFHKRSGKTRERRDGCPHCLSVEELKRKQRIEQYNQYKVDLATMAKQMQFTLPDSGFALYFFFPMTTHMQRREALRRRMHGAPHTVKPDYDNLVKAFQDALRKDDSRIYHVAGLGKYWTAGAGYIEVHLDLLVYDPRVTDPNFVDLQLPAFTKSKGQHILWPKGSNGEKKKIKFDLREDSDTILYAQPGPQAYECDQVVHFDDEPQFPWMAKQEAEALADLKKKAGFVAGLGTPNSGSKGDAPVYGVNLFDPIGPTYPDPIKPIKQQGPVNVNDKELLGSIISRNVNRHKKKKP